MGNVECFSDQFRAHERHHSLLHLPSSISGLDRAILTARQGQQAAQVFYSSFSINMMRANRPILCAAGVIRPATRSNKSICGYVHACSARFPSSLLAPGRFIGFGRLPSDATMACSRDHKRIAFSPGNRPTQPSQCCRAGSKWVICVGGTEIHLPESDRHGPVAPKAALNPPGGSTVLWDVVYFASPRKQAVLRML